MARKRKNAAPATAPDSRLRDLALDSFRVFGAQVVENGSGAIRVSLPEALAAHFEKPALNLVFSTQELSPYHDLVAFGSRVFDRLVDYIALHGSLSRQALPDCFPDLATRTVPAGVALGNCEAVHTAGHAVWRYLFQFNFHISYRADDKQEEMVAIALDQDGQVVGDLPALLAQSHPAPAEAAAPRQDLVLTLAEEARRLAIGHGDQRCAVLEQEILPRLHKILSRLINYYEQQALEIQGRTDDMGRAEAQREQLRADLQRKIAEEVENHRLRVTVTLVSVAQVLQPTWEHRLSLRSHDAAEPYKLTLTRNLYTGNLGLPACHACDVPTAVVSLCANGHVTCPQCLARCHACRRDICLACGVQGCVVCKEPLCESCALVCPACGGWACTEHTNRCAVCQETTCLACQDVCSGCGVRQCRSHLVSDYLAPAERLCHTCALICPLCDRPSAHTASCAYCGQVFCRDCTGTCYACQRTYCDAHLTVDAINGGTVCAACLVDCPHCGTRTASLGQCATCAAQQCTSCLQACAECGTMVCDRHRHVCGLCYRPVCEQHAGLCYVDDQPVCSSHSLECPVCERTVCHLHQKYCVVCGLAYCPDCINAARAICQTCQQLDEAETVNLALEPVAQDPDVGVLAERYTWRAARNRRYTVYLGIRHVNQMTLVANHDGVLIRTTHLRHIGNLLRWNWRLFG